MRRVPRELLTTDSEESVPLRLCRAVLDVTGASGAAVTIPYGAVPAVRGTWGDQLPSRSVLCSTGEGARRFEDVQDLAGEGPGFDVLVDGLPVSVGDSFADPDRWPLLVAALAGDRVDYPALEVVAMKPGPVILGSLAVHHDPQEWAVAVGDLQFFADVIGAVVLDTASEDEDAARWWTRDLVAQATGMIVMQLGLTPEDARIVLQAHAFSEHTTVIDVSRRVVARTLHFRDDAGDGHEGRMGT